jgi:flagellar biosynthetic protein FliR
MIPSFEFAYTFVLLFVRCGAMFLAAPIFGGFGIPPRIRVWLSAVIAIALAPVVQPMVGAVPSEFIMFIGALLREAAIGIVIGTLLQIVMLAAQTAGQFIDVQIGFGIMRMLNPASGFPTSVLAQFKTQLALVLLLVLNGHHILFRALVASYEYSPAVGMAQIPGMQDVVVQALVRLFMLALQIAAPAAAVAFITDAALACVARAVPQMNVLIVGFPAKILLGVLGVTVSLPVLLWAVREGLELTANAISWFLQGGLG